MEKEDIFLDGDRLLNCYVAYYTLNGDIIAIAEDQTHRYIAEKQAYKNLKERLGLNITNYNIINY